MDFFKLIQQLTLFEQIIGVIFLLSSFVQIVYYLLIFSKLAFYKDESEPNIEKMPVSVVISAHDEDYNLIENLPYVLNQNYPDFEVIVVNHASTDDTNYILNDFQRKYKQLKVVNIDQDLNFFKGKKFPLSIGIKSAKHEILLLTDADCKPTSDGWISAMVENYTTNTELVLGYGPYKQISGLLNLFIRYDTFMIAMQYFSFALIGIPYMGVGRNLSYRRSTFFKNKGFTSHYNIPSGDDDLFVQQVANSKNTKIEVSDNSYMVSNPKPDFRSWLTQKQRHLSTSSSYSVFYKILLASNSITQLLFYATLLILLIGEVLVVYTLIIMIITLAVRIFIQNKSALRLGENQLLLFSLFGDIFYVVLLPLIAIVSLTGKTKSWK